MRLLVMAISLAAGCGALLPPALPAQPDRDGGAGGAPGRSRQETRHTLSFDLRANHRSSDDNAFPVAFPFPPGTLPPGQANAFLRTVEPGDHTEVSLLSLQWDVEIGAGFAARLKLDGIDRYDRNPTSTDFELDVDEAWVRFGRETATATLAERSGGYVRVGKFGRFERQNDRHLESYGLVSTAFNRFEDAGLEAGADIGPHFYVKASFTQGNPVFLRDPNALAGDNGTPGLLQRPASRELESGIPILYDAEIEWDGLDFEHPERALGLGLRFANADASRAVEVLAFANQRELADTVELNGTFYGGDLDLLDGPDFDPRPYPVTSDDKEEVGANLWLYLGDFSLFGQWVDQDIGGLGRVGYEGEVAWRFELPLGPAVRGKQIFPFVQPAVRYSKIEPDFRAPAGTPSPSFSWEWDKWDYGVRLGLVGRTDLTVEHARNRFILGSGREVENDEWLVTLRVRFRPVRTGAGSP
ncbi:MAG TPA: hypothetical protein VNB06_04545 [Thermoanaerobaculia bacterium]|nr:hypothetical protein [Thermoanaerobaculia bacterium]